jgi:hypothetical protein
MRRANDRRARSHRNRTATGELPTLTEPEGVDDEVVVTERQVGPIVVTGDGPPVVREKTHSARPMTLDQALYEMELVGHDFYLYVDQDTQRPAVVYRRRGYDYGVISLDVERAS